MIDKLAPDADMSTLTHRPYRHKVIGRSFFGKANEFQFYYEDTDIFSMSGIDYEGAERIVGVLNGAYLCGRMDQINETRWLQNEFNLIKQTHADIQAADENKG